MTSARTAPDELSAPSDGDTPALFGPRPPSVERLRLATLCLLLVLVVFAQDSGGTASDTKIDLFTDPARFLTKALSLWDSTGNAGQLQNQAYGYLFPTGPFFLLCHWIGLEPWVAQRAWAAALVVAAFLGTTRLARRLGVAGFWAPVAAGLTYALAPQILSELFSISAGLTPTVALPWVLLPLVRGAECGSPRRAAALSGVALLCAGGANAAATVAILPAPALWLLCRRRGPRRAALLRWWAAAVVLAGAWWAIPLLLFGKYSPPFLDWIEAAQNTTAPTSVSANLRGVEHWESYLGPGVWPAGWILVRAGAAILATTAVVALGLAGLARRSPHRLFLLGCLGAGLTILSIGHLAPVTGPFAAQFQGALDGPLVAFRNIHKFDPLIRLPVAIGIGAAVSGLRIPWWQSVRSPGGTLRVPGRALLATVLAVVALIAVSPVLSNRLLPQSRAQAVPPWWRAAGVWLDQHSRAGRTLVVPGASTPTYFWGSTIDDALQPVTDAPWIVRSSIPLAPAGTIRLLDAISSRLDTGHRDDALAALLARSGISYVLVRNDLDTAASLSTPYNIVRSTLLNSPGFTLQAGFGPTLDGPSDGRVVDAGAGVPRPAIEVFGVQNALPRAGLAAAADAVTADGSSDNLGALVERGLPPERPVLFGADATALADAGPLSSVRTDGIRRQQADFGSTAVKSSTLTAAEPYLGRRAAYDYLPSPAPVLSSMSYTGIRSVTASSSGAGVYAPFNRSPANGPFAAVDGDPNTAWRSAAFSGAVGQWLELDLQAPISAASFTVRFLPTAGEYPSRLTVQTSGGGQTYQVAATPAPQTFTLPAGATSRLRLTVRATTGGSFGAGVAIADLTVPGVHPQRTLAMPGTRASDMLAFDAAPGFRDGCLDVEAIPHCSAELAAAGEEDGELSRRLSLASARSYRAYAQLRLLGGSVVDAALDLGRSIRATATSVNSTDPRGRPGAAVDGDPSTAWTAAAGDPTPSLTVQLGAVRTIRGLHLRGVTSAAATAAARPLAVQVRVGSYRWKGPVPADGRIRFPRVVKGRTVVLTVEEASLLPSVSTLDGQARLLPVAIGEVSVDGGGATPVTAPTAAVRLGCTKGVRLVLDGRSIPLAVTAARSDVLAGRPVTATVCDGRAIELRAGGHTLTVAGPTGVLPRTLTLTDGIDLRRTSAPAGTATITRWRDTQRRLLVSTSARAVLVVHENFNAGWSARVGVQHLQPVRIDGWEQAFVLPAGTSGTVLLSYGPQPLFGAALLVGLLAVLALLGLALVPPGRAEPAPSGPAALSVPVQVLLLLAMCLQTTGPAGLATGTLLLLTCRLLWPGGRAVPSWVPAAVLLAAGIEIASSPATSRFTVANSSLTQLLSISAVVLTVLAGLPGWRRRRRRRRRRAS
jgi:arabinofuranan 3-O-arabinosyltransferase